MRRFVTLLALALPVIANGAELKNSTDDSLNALPSTNKSKAQQSANLDTPLIWTAIGKTSSGLHLSPLRKIHYFSPPRCGLVDEVDNHLQCSVPDELEPAIAGVRRHFRIACTAHDFCYRHGAATYGRTRKQCDDDFLRDMKIACGLTYSGRKDRLECGIRADTMWTVVRTAGITAYRLKTLPQADPLDVFKYGPSRVCEYDNRAFSDRPRWPRVGDVDGDGRSDLVFYSRPSGIANADGKIQIRTLLARPGGAWSERRAWVDWGIPSNARLLRRPMLVADIDGDRLDDLIFIAQSDPRFLDIHALIAIGDGSWRARKERVPVSLGPTLIPGTGPLDHATLTGDIDGDGRADLIFPTATLTGLKVISLLSRGEGTWAPHLQRIGSNRLVHLYPTRVGDVDGDSRADLVFMYHRDENTRTGEPSGLMVMTLRSEITAGDGAPPDSPQVTGSWVAHEVKISWGLGVNPGMMGDVNADGRSDLIFLYQHPRDGLEVRTLRSNWVASADSGFPAQRWSASSLTIGWAKSVHQFPTVVGDFNGDHRADLLMLMLDDSNPGVLVAGLFSRRGGGWDRRIQPVVWNGNYLEFPTITGDVDGNGRAELILLHLASNRISVASLSFNHASNWIRRDSPTEIDRGTVAAPIAGREISLLEDGKWRHQ